MAKKKSDEAAQTAEDIHLEKESKRLRELAYSRGLLSKEKALPEEPLLPKLGKWISSIFVLTILAVFLQHFQSLFQCKWQQPVYKT